ncbi:LysR family transcriptional regulator [Nocardioides donggukensis]|uniref:LysR family transcriptional regulator n=1 Tax=Nocardioides donggukensis TaxID=2774019 RepID=A0A927PYL3_9ACTN|nr:LysR family transcriptional regulator [Nocardioides donggukensis]MBD8868393.1 LysR family transcriptional regulator [Nocardioides donggukensis]
MTSRPDLDDLDLLGLVARCGSIGQAAAELGLSQPAVSRRVAALERSLGVVLLHRSRQGSVLTPAGRVVVDWATSLLDAADGFSRSVATLRDERDASLRVAVSMTIAEHHAPAWLASLAEVTPRLRVSMSVTNSTEVADRVEQGGADIGFLESPTVRSSLRRRRFAWDDLVVAVPPGHPWADRDEPLAARLLAEAALLVREPGSGTRETLEHALARMSLTLTPGFEMASNAALRSAAIAGAGPVVLSASALADDLAAGRLVAVPVPDLDLRRPLTAVWRRDAVAPPGVRSLLEVVGRLR